jgi:hypothetical protein
MKRILYISSKNSVEFNTVTDDKKRTWYFVHWDKSDIDENGNYTIYTHKGAFGERIPVFKSKDWGVICNVGNMLNGLFHSYFQISNSYSLTTPLNLDTLLKINKEKLSLWKSLKTFLLQKFKSF